MAQHSHSVYGNGLPFQYQKNAGTSHPTNYNIGRSTPNYNNNFGPTTNNELLSKKNMFKSTEVLNRSGRLPFSDRNGKLHRSNPHIHFGGLKLSETHSKSASSAKTASKWKSEISNAAHLMNRKWCDFVFRRNTDNKLYRSESFRFLQKTPSLKLVPPLSAGLHRYRSKKYQVPVSDDYVEPLDRLDQVLGGRNKASRLASQESPSSQDSPQGWNNKSTSYKAGLVTDNEDQDDDADSAAYNEIIEPYNAPYYYADTIKQEPTYCSPCSTWNNQSCTRVGGENQRHNHVQEAPHNPPDHKNPPVALSSSNSQPSKNPQSQHYRVVVVGGGEGDIPQNHHHHQNQHHHHNASADESPPPFNPTSVVERMARKRYETAFLPSSSAHPSQPSSPDVDSLLLAIESSCSLSGGGGQHHRTQNNHQHYEEDNVIFLGERNHQRGGGIRASAEEEEEGGGGNWKREENIESDPSIQSYRQSSHHHHYQQQHSHCSVPAAHIISSGGGSTTATSSPLSDKKSKPNMPLSEPLPQKKYTNNNNHHNNNNSSSSSSPSTSASFTSCRPSDKRLLLTMMKDNSVSSLESIDSTKSDDCLHPFSRPYGDSTTHHPHHQNQYIYQRGMNSGGGGGPYFGRGNCKLLSPISDKSPLEPSSLVQQQQQQSSSNDSHYNPQSSSHQGTNDLKPWSGGGGQHQHHHYHQINTAELINVPWDMPKIRRRLALLADSGISLDCSGNASSESGGGGGKSFEDSTFHQYTSRTHIRGNSADLRVTSDSVIDNNSSTQQQCNPPPATTAGRGSSGSNSSSSGRSSRLHNLQLNLDNGMMMEGEYYEDPRLNFTEQVVPQPPPKPRPWVTNVTSVQVHNPSSSSSDHPVPPPKPDRCRMTLDFGAIRTNASSRYDIDPSIELEAQEWFHGAITRSEAEAILRATKEGSFLVRNCESSSFNRYSLSLKSARGYIHIRIEPNSLGSFSLGEHEFPSVPHLVLHFMCHRLPIKGAEHVKLMYPVITQLL